MRALIGNKPATQVAGLFSSKNGKCAGSSARIRGSAALGHMEVGFRVR